MASECMCEPKCKVIYNCVARRIKEASEKFVKDYWNKRRGEDVDENKALEELIEFIKKTPRRPKSNESEASSGSKEDKKDTMDNDECDKEAIRRKLDIVAKHNMSTYYNMFLPRAVCVFSIAWCY